MSREIRIEAHGNISLAGGFPPKLSSYLIPQAQAYHAQGPWGLICFQELKTEKHLLQHFVFALHQAITFYIETPRKALQSLLSLRGEFEHRVEGLKSIALKEKDFVLLVPQQKDVITTVREGSIKSLLNAFYPIENKDWLLSSFPRLQSDLFKHNRKPFYITVSSKTARYTIHDAIKALWFDKYIPELQKKHVQLRLESSFFTQLAQSYTPKRAKKTSQLERDKALAAREIILRNIKKHLTPKEITAELECSVSWLRKAFAKVYQIGMFQFLRQTRMEIAKEMLLLGKSLKEAAIEVGMRPGNFPKEFKAYFGYTVTTLKSGLI